MLIFGRPTGGFDGYLQVMVWSFDDWQFGSRLSFGELAGSFGGHLDS